MALVYLGEDMRARLFAVREKDSGEITGTFDSESWNTPDIQGHATPSASRRKSCEKSAHTHEWEGCAECLVRIIYSARASWCQK